MSVAQLNRRELLAAASVAGVAGAAMSCVGLSPAMGQARARTNGVGEITDMTMNSPPYATQIGYGRAGHAHDGTDPVALAFGV